MPVKLYRLGVMASLVLAIAFSAPLQAQTDDSREQMIDLVLQIQQLQDEVRSLRGQLEEQAILIETLQRRQRDQYLDLDQRISDPLPVVVADRKKFYCWTGRRKNRRAIKITELL